MLEEQRPGRKTSDALRHGLDVAQFAVSGDAVKHLLWDRETGQGVGYAVLKLGLAEGLVILP